jgi:tetratricopeptide (TPR) repeat protein/transcriptional regulator with XRE-family HTH domain
MSITHGCRSQRQRTRQFTRHFENEVRCMNRRADAKKTELLYRARRKVRISQTKAGAHFGVSRDSVSEWENGLSIPERDRLPLFASYLWDVLGLRHTPEVFDHIWLEVIVREWGGSLLEDNHPQHERTASSPKLDSVVPPFEVDAPTADFVGREAEIAEVVACLHEVVLAGKAAICGIRGMGGVGKTQLARAVAHEVRDLFPDGQIVVGLRGDIRSHSNADDAVAPVQALRRIVRMLTNQTDLPGSEHDLAALYRSALSGKRILILADNARDEAQVEPFRPPVGCALLVTSREHIHLEGMQSFLLGVLSPEKHGDAANSLLLRICPRIGSHAPELAKLCGYLPLALRVCASFLEATKMRPLHTFLTQLHAERLRHMVRPGRAQDDPEASVEASLSLSYNDLTPDSQRVLQQLGVFPASFDLEAAQAIVEGTELVQEALEELYRRSMIEWHEGTDRYNLHDLVREFALGRLEDGDAVRLRHAQHFAGRMKQAEKTYIGGNQLAGLALFDQERENIDAGWTWARAHSGTLAADELLIEYDGSSFYVGDLRYDNRTERIWQAEAMRDAALRLGRRDALVQAYNNLAIPFHLLGEYPQAIDAYEKGLALARELGDARQEGNLLNNLGFALIDIGDFDKAIEYNLARVAIAKRLPDRNAALRGEAAGMANLADAYLKRKDAQLSLECAKRGYELTTAYGDQRGQCTALGNIAAAYCALGDEAQAIPCYEEAITLAEALKDKRELAGSSWQLGKLLEERDPARALTLMHIKLDYLAALHHPDLAEHQAEYAALQDRITKRASRSFHSRETGA